MTRCKICGCKLLEGDTCRRCQYEQDWLNTPERFCKHCGDHIPGAVEDRYCPKCADEFKKPERPPAGNCGECGRRLTPSGHCYSCTTRKQMEAKKKERELLVMRKIRMRNEKCATCGHQLTLNGSCRKCLGRAAAEKRFGKPSMGTCANCGSESPNNVPCPVCSGKTENPAPKTGAKTLCKETPKSVTQTPPNVKPGHVFKEMPGVGEYCPESAAATIHARPAPASDTPLPITAFRNIVEVKLLHPAARKPEYKTPGAAGFDLCAIDSRLVRPGESERFMLGLAFAIPEGFEIQIRPRSGLSFNTPLIAKNTIGTIDSDYRGEIAFILYNSGKEPVYIEAGDRICQGVLARVPRADFMLVEELSETDRGAGGFGSTGK